MDNINNLFNDKNNIKFNQFICHRSYAVHMFEGNWWHDPDQRQYLNIFTINDIQCSQFQK